MCLQGTHLQQENNDVLNAQCLSFSHKQNFTRQQHKFSSYSPNENVEFEVLIAVIMKSSIYLSIYIYIYIYMFIY
jgi:hypothetical protein